MVALSRCPSLLAALALVGGFYSQSRALAQEGEAVTGVVVDGWANPCAGQLELSGDLGAAREVADRLPVDLPADACAGARVDVEPVEAGYRIRFARDERAVERNVDDVAAAAIWVESWVTPNAFATAATVEAAGTGPAEFPQATDDERPPPIIVTVREQRGPEWLLSATADTSFGDLGGTWLGPEVSLALHVSDLFYFGGALGGTFDIDEGAQGVDRTEIRAAVRGGVRVGLPMGDLRIGLGVGLAERVIHIESGPNPRTEDEGGEYLELGADLAIPLTDSFAFVGGAFGRVHDVEGPDEEDLPLPLSVPELVGGVRVGLAWTTGGDR